MKERTIWGIAATLALMGAATPALAQESYVGEIITVGFNFCPQGTLSAEGQLLPIAQYQALYSLYGTMYGGDGRTNFQLPDLRGRTPVGQGAGPGLQPVQQGQQGGAEQAVITVNQMPVHTHAATLMASNEAALSPDPKGNALASGAPGQNVYAEDPAPNVPLGDNSIAVENAGGGQPLGLRDPFLALRYCVVVQGVYPVRS